MRNRNGLVAALVLVCLGLCASSGWASWVKDGVLLCDGSGSEYGMKVVADGSGGAFFVWVDNRAMMSTDIYCNKIDAHGNLLGPSSGIAVCTAAGSQSDPQIVSDGAGGAIMVWLDGRSGNRIYAQRVDGTGAVQWAANGILLSGATNAQTIPRMAPDGSGGAFIAWSESVSGSYDIYVQHVDADGNRLFGTNGIALIAATGSQYMRDVEADGAGGAVLVWLDSRSGTSDDVYAQRFNASGTALWTANGVGVCTADGDQRNPEVVPSGSGAIVFWDGLNGSAVNDVFASGLDADGNIVWGAGGASITNASEGKLGFHTVPDGVGGAIVEFYMYGYGDIPFVYAQRVDQTGNTLWGGYGVCVFPAGGESGVHLIPDGSGGAITALDAYYDESWYYAHIYAQRFDSSGALQWTAPRGVNVCSSFEYQVDPVLCSDGAGGAIIVWIDSRSGGSDLYVQKVGANGLWGDPEPAIASCADLPGDQGGWVAIGVRASSHDIVAEKDYPIAGYNVWRAKTRLDPGALPATPGGPVAGNAGRAGDRAGLLGLFADPSKLAGTTLSREQALLLGFPGGEWESVAYQYATQDTLYDIAAPTRNDSTEADAAREVFIVTAHTTTPNVFLMSQPDTAWSVDNIPPGVTPGLAGSETESPAGLLLSWEPNGASDLWKYNVHRGEDALFKPRESNLVGSTTDAELHDGTWTKPSRYFYKLIAVDRHGNAGSAALLRPEDVKVGTTLASFAAALAGSVIEISWTLSETDETATFLALRSIDGGAYAELASAAIIRSGAAYSLCDESIEPGTTYRYRIDLVGADGARALFETESISTPAMPLTLHQNAPNPFNPATTISFYLPRAAAVTLDVYDSAGSLVTRLLDGAVTPRGTHRVEWRGVDREGRSVSSGVYFYRLRAGRETISKKMVLVR